MRLNAPLACSATVVDLYSKTRVSHAQDVDKLEYLEYLEYLKYLEYQLVLQRIRRTQGPDCESQRARVNVWSVINKLIWSVINKLIWSVINKLIWSVMNKLIWSVINKLIRSVNSR